MYVHIWRLKRLALWSSFLMGSALKPDWLGDMPGTLLECDIEIQKVLCIMKGWVAVG